LVSKESMREIIGRGLIVNRFSCTLVRYTFGRLPRRILCSAITQQCPTS
jgi:hypothetical protein